MTAVAAGLLIVLALAGVVWLIARRIAPDFDGWRFHGRAQGRSGHDAARAAPLVDGAAAGPVGLAGVQAAAAMPPAMAGATPGMGATPAATPAAATPAASAAAAPAPMATGGDAAAAPAADTAAASGATTAIGVPGAVGAPDDLLQLKGVGPVLNKLLISLGVRRFDQIAGWSASDIATVDAHLGNFKGRIARDNWVEQAGLLARGAIADFEAKYGKLDSENK